MMNNKSFWDMDKNGKFDIVDIFWLALQLIAYGAGAVLMLSTFTRSFHLLSSPMLNPGAFWWWPWLTAASPEAGLVIAWLAGEVGFRKGRMELVALSTIGFIAFGVVIGTMQLYDVALVEGQDITLAQTWAHWVASILPLITISYCAIASMLLSYMARREKLKSEPVEWSVQRPRLPVGRAPEPIREEYGEPLTDPLSQSVGGRRVRPNPKGSPHQTATKTALEALNSIRSVGSNGRSEEQGETDFT